METKDPSADPQEQEKSEGVNTEALEAPEVRELSLASLDERVTSLEHQHTAIVTSGEGEAEPPQVKQEATAEIETKSSPPQSPPPNQNPAEQETPAPSSLVSQNQTGARRILKRRSRQSRRLHLQ